MKLQILFGVEAPSIAEQLKAQGFKVSKEHSDGWQKDSHEIMRLGVRGVLSKKEIAAARNRILKNILEKYP